MRGVSGFNVDVANNNGGIGAPQGAGSGTVSSDTTYAGLLSVNGSAAWGDGLTGVYQQGIFFPNTLNISGLSSVLSPDQTYTLYVFAHNIAGTSWGSAHGRGQLGCVLHL